MAIQRPGQITVGTVLSPGAFSKAAVLVPLPTTARVFTAAQLTPRAGGGAESLAVFSIWTQPASSTPDADAPTNTYMLDHVRWRHEAGFLMTVPFLACREVPRDHRFVGLGIFNLCCVADIFDASAFFTG